MSIETINLHVWPRCNLACRYCYATFQATSGSLPLADWQALLDLINVAGVRRVNFSGGEPTLHPELTGMLRHARSVGLQTSIISNGTRLNAEMISLLDLVGVTLDSRDDSVLVRLGRQSRRRVGSHVASVRAAAALAHELGVRLKINTVVTALNLTEDLNELLSELRPFKWKPLQFSTVVGENDGDARELSVSGQAFREFVARHASLANLGIWVAPETAAVIGETYVMVDPIGRLFQQSRHEYRVSEPVLRVGLEAALEQVGGYNREAFLQRGGAVDVHANQLARGSR